MAVSTGPPQPKPGMQTLEQLMELYQRSGSEAGTALVETLTRQVFQFFLKQARNRADAEDLLQEFWLRIHNARRTYRPGEPVLPWIYAIAHRVRVDHYRRTKRVIDHERVDENLARAAAPQSSAAGPGIAELLKKLPESQREVILLMKVAGLTLEEVARATGSSIGAVKQKAHRGYEKLRSMFGEAK